jgi:4-hydroxythreonine-4-phosphate dehydrogenase
LPATPLASRLNPDAGETGTMGHEDDAVPAPAIARSRPEGIDPRGPYPADSTFLARAQSRYNAALAMYHGRALITVRTIAFDERLDDALDLPFIQTSPNHGTVVDIAGKDIARPSSLCAARMAERTVTGAAA